MSTSHAKRYSRGEGRRVCEQQKLISHSDSAQFDKVGTCMFKSIQ